MQKNINIRLYKNNKLHQEYNNIKSISNNKLHFIIDNVHTSISDSIFQRENEEYLFRIDLNKKIATYLLKSSNMNYDMEPVSYKIDPSRAKKYIVDLLNGWFMYLPDDLSNKECTGADSTNLGFTSNIGSKNVYEYCSGNKTYAKAVEDFMNLIGESKLKNFDKDLEKKYGNK